MDGDGVMGEVMVEVRMIQAIQHTPPSNPVK
jgi:hypothetical protein